MWRFSPPPRVFTSGDFRHCRSGDRISSLCYTASSGRVSNVTPGQFFYYTVIKAPSRSFCIDVVQTKSLSTHTLFDIQQLDQATLWNSSCTKSATGTTICQGQGRVCITNATVGMEYVLSMLRFTQALHHQRSICRYHQQLKHLYMSD